MLIYLKLKLLSPYFIWRNFREVIIPENFKFLLEKFSRKRNFKSFARANFRKWEIFANKQYAKVTVFISIFFSLLKVFPAINRVKAI